MDFNIVLLNAIKAINTSIQKLGDYVDQNTYALGAGHIIQIAGVAAVLGDITGIWTNRVTVNGEATVSGVLEVVTQFDGSIAAGSGIVAPLDSQPELISSVNGISTIIVSSELDVIAELISSVVEGSGIDGAMTIMWTETAQGEIDAESSVDAKLPVEMELVGSITSTGQCGGGPLDGIA